MKIQRNENLPTFEFKALQNRTTFAKLLHIKLQLCIFTSSKYVDVDANFYSIMQQFDPLLDQNVIFFNI